MSRRKRDLINTAAIEEIGFVRSEPDTGLWFAVLALGCGGLGSLVAEKVSRFTTSTDHIIRNESI